MIKNVYLKKCIHGTHGNSRISLVQCKSHSRHQQWSWDPSTSSLIMPHNKGCLTVKSMHAFAPVKLEPCGSNSQHQAWICNKKGHLNLQGLDLHLNAKPNSNKVFVSTEKDKFSKWKTVTDESICTGDRADEKHTGHVQQKIVDMPSLIHKMVNSSESMTLPWTPRVGLNYSTSVTELSSITWTRKDKMVLTEENSTNWKIAMLVLSPLAFTLGLLILILNIQYNKKKKRIPALKSYPRPALGATLARERSLLTATAGSPQRHTKQVSPTPSLRYGEILIEWKDGTVTPLFDNFSY
nr:uncharacterized protein LOC117352659 isoform X2 [Geotrypetes seraphini]